MQRQRRVKRQRRIIVNQLKYSDSDVKQIILEFLHDRLNPAKGGFFEIIYNNTMPFLDEWFKLKLNKK